MRRAAVVGAVLGAVPGIFAAFLILAFNGMFDSAWPFWKCCWYAAVCVGVTAGVGAALFAVACGTVLMALGKSGPARFAILAGTVVGAVLGAARGLGGGPAFWLRGNSSVLGLLLGAALGAMLAFFAIILWCGWDPWGG
jgi:hypothetical protein